MLGGETSDAKLASSLMSPPAPIVVNLLKGGSFRWGVVLSAPGTYDRASVIKYNPSGDKIFGAVDTISTTKQRAAVFVLNA